MRYSQEKVALFDMDTYYVSMVSAMTWMRGRQNRFTEEKYTEKYTTNTSIPHPSVSVVKDWECIRDKYSAINILTLPMHLLTGTITSSFCI